MVIVARAFFSLALARIGYFSEVQMTRSSAKRALDIFIWGGRSLMKMRNSVQLSAEPCGSPSSRVFLEEVNPSTVVWIVLSVKKA